jgi:hypothetical protein
MKRRCLFLLIVIAFILNGCDNDSGLPESGGRPYDVTVSGKDDMMKDLVINELTKSVDGLPQDESQFDVTKVNDLNRFTSLSRNIVEVVESKSVSDEAQLSYSKNVNAKPQMIIRVIMPYGVRRPKNIESVGRTLRLLLTRGEMNREIAHLSRFYDVRTSKLADKQFNIKINIPQEMKWSKQGQQFIWISNNAPRGMQNICIYTVKGDKNISTARLIELRDSVMHKNIKGETDSMYMLTSRNMPVKTEVTSVKGKPILVMRGLWEMENYAMGGPFVSHIIRRGNDILIAEAFVFAPEMKKRNLIRQSEAALYTLNVKH